MSFNKARREGKAYLFRFEFVNHSRLARVVQTNDDDFGLFLAN